ncbi:beta-galactosidase, partial [candidate division KSB1 bacterium]|nr:beta-galactosidase [candidate division KSB1 bacterium]
MRKIILMLAVICLAISACAQKNEVFLSLQGEWNFKLDREDLGIKEAWYNHHFTDIINLPGSLQEQGYGDPPSLETEWIGSIINEREYQLPKYDEYKQPDHFKFPFWLTPDKYYKGVAWYQKEVELPENWRRKRVFLDLERCHWATTVFVDGKCVGSDSSLCVPHRYELTSALNEIPGKHTLTIRVDNRMIVNVGPNSHSVSDHTQSNWNGIVGKIQLRAAPAIRIQDIKITPDIETGSVKVKVWLEQGPPDGKLILLASNSNTQKNQVLPTLFVPAEADFIEVDYPMGETPLLWDEFEPNLYQMNVRFESRFGVDEKEVLFGMRKIETRGTRIFVNNRPTFMRGTLECAIFPKTGYPAMDVKAWERIFNVVKSYGLNHMRFHSWCPPEAAFIAADRKGVYLHVEGPTWANWGTSLGDGLSIDSYIYSESERILREYGNHPSFVMFAYGNEPGGENHVQFLTKFVTHFKNKDNRRLYTSGAGWPNLPENDFLSFSDPRIQRWGEGLNSVINAQPPNTKFNYHEIVSNYDQPMISHEIGQWCVYPNFDEIPKYNGVLKSKNFEIFRDFLEASHMGHQARDFFIASGKLQALCYKADIEAALRTPGFGGFQLLDLHDFPGQGTALVGVVDPFWDEKDYISPKEYSRFCNTTVPLALMPARTWTTSDTFAAEIQISHFGKNEIRNAEISWTILAEIQNE